RAVRRPPARRGPLRQRRGAGGPDRPGLRAGPAGARRVTGRSVEPRRTWRAVERVHAVVYFAPEVRAALEDAGLRGFWRGYFAARAAPLGPVGAEVVAAVTFGFAPEMVARAVPDVWTRAAPPAALAA